MINLLQATAPAPQAGGNYSLFIMLGLMILVLYFFMWRPESESDASRWLNSGPALRKATRSSRPAVFPDVVKEIRDDPPDRKVDGNVTLRIDKNMVVADTSDLRQQRANKSTGTRELPSVIGKGFPDYQICFITRVWRCSL